MKVPLLEIRNCKTFIHLHLVTSVTVLLVEQLAEKHVNEHDLTSLGRLCIPHIYDRILQLVIS